MHCSCTECIFGVDVIENSVRHELERIFTRAAARLSVQHFQLCLTLVELLVVALLQRNARMRLVDGDRQIIPHALYLHTAATRQMIIHRVHKRAWQLLASLSSLPLLSADL